jgi:hypothetical protein
LSNYRLRQLTRRALGWATILFVLLFSVTAMGAGRVEWKTKKLKERTDSKSWRIEVAIYLNSAPDTAYVPVKFEFQPIAYYERAMVDGDKLVERTVPLQHNQSLIESVEVGFLDPGTATIQKRTKFSFKVTRAHDYSAGEYKVTITDARTGQKIGQPQKIIFEGENAIIDRRSITFSGKKKEKKEDKEEEKKEGSDEGGGEGWDDDGTKEVDLQNEDEDDWEEEEYDEGEIEEKPGACGCRVGPSRSQPLAPLALLAGLLVLGFRRKLN